ncbi:MAG: InlB B-repeat-containing protein [Fibrobacteres bacterium]|nr:InlB B-repeat-containing protein [Fibrobacterota bacterium]
MIKKRGLLQLMWMLLLSWFAPESSAATEGRYTGTTSAGDPFWLHVNSASAIDTFSIKYTVYDFYGDPVVTSTVTQYFMPGYTIPITVNSFSYEKKNSTDTTMFAGTISGTTASGTFYYSKSVFTKYDREASEKLTWTAVFGTPTGYSVKYNGNLNNNGSAPIDATVYATGAKATVLTSGSLSRTGYTFSSWNTAANGSGTSYAPASTITIGSANVVLYARWTALPSYSVTYNANGATSGTAAFDASIYNSGASVTVLGNTGSIAKTGYTFVGWNTAADGSGASFAPAASFAMGSANVTLYAKWRALPTYSVNYDANGATSGTAPTDPATYLAAASVTVLGNTGSLAKTGYTFVGWNTAADGSGASFAPAASFAMGSANVTLYAKWRALPTYSVNYDGNGNTSGTAPTDPATYLAAASVTVLGNTGSLAKTGYTFVGWNTAADGSGASFAPAASFAMGSANVTLYAKWSSLPTYSVTYDANGATSGTAPTDPATYLAAASVTVLGNTGSLAKTGYTFVGWNTAADGSGASFAPAASFAMGSANVTLYAKWRALPTYSVTYDANGATSGTAPTDPATYLAAASVTVLGNTGSLAKTGYTFVGWNTAADGSGASFAPAASFAMGSANVTLHAKWRALPYRVIAITDGHGAVTPSDTQTVAFGNTIRLRSTPEAGYHFANWSVVRGNPKITSANVDSTDLIAGGDSLVISVRATFQKNSYALKISHQVGTDPAVLDKDTTASFGDTIALNAPALSGKTFLHWTVGGSTAKLVDSAKADAKVVLNAGDATVVAVYKESGISVLRKGMPTSLDLVYDGRMSMLIVAVPERRDESATHVQIDLIDHQGRSVARLVNSPLTPGYHAFDLKTSGISSGRLISRMRADGFDKAISTPVLR